MEMRPLLSPTTGTAAQATGSHLPNYGRDLANYGRDPCKLRALAGPRFCDLSFLEFPAGLRLAASLFNISAKNTHKMQS